MAKGIQVINRQVTTAGTPVAVQTVTTNPRIRYAQSLVLTAPFTNTGTVYLGLTGVTNGAASTGFPIRPGVIVEIPVSFFGASERAIDLTVLFVNADTSNDRLVFLFDSEL